MIQARTFTKASTSSCIHEYYYHHTHRHVTFWLFWYWNYWKSDTYACLTILIKIHALTDILCKLALMPDYDSFNQNLWHTISWQYKITWQLILCLIMRNPRILFLILLILIILHPLFQSILLASSYLPTVVSKPSHAFSSVTWKNFMAFSISATRRLASPSTMPSCRPSVLLSSSFCSAFLHSLFASLSHILIK